MKSSICFMLIFLSIISMISVQETDGLKTPNNPDAIFAPFVSRIRVGEKENSIVLLWEDSQDVDGVNTIFRYTQEITSSNIKQAEKIGEVPNGVGTFIDTPSSTGSFFYCILLKTSQGSIYEVFVPFKNKTISGIQFNKNSSPKIAAVQNSKAEITEIKSIVEGSAILVTFKSSLRNLRYVIYRGTSQFTESRDLLEATAAGVVNETNLPFKDFPVPGIEYYYSVIEENALKSEQIVFTSDLNSTAKPVILQMGNLVSGLPEIKNNLLRPTPLPNLIINIEVSAGTKLKSDGIFLPIFREFGIDTQKAAKELTVMGLEPNYQMPAPVILQSEKSGSNFGENYTLSTIINSEFTMKNYEKARLLIEKFLSIYRSDETKARAQFYLGQCLTYIGKYREAFFQFLLAENKAIDNISIWENYLLAQLQKHTKESNMEN